MLSNQYLKVIDVVVLASSCSLDLEYMTVKCRPDYLPLEFTSVILTAAYMLPRADIKLALNELYSIISSQEA